MFKHFNVRKNGKLKRKVKREKKKIFFLFFLQCFNLFFSNRKKFFLVTLFLIRPPLTFFKKNNNNDDDKDGDVDDKKKIEWLARMTRKKFFSRFFLFLKTNVFRSANEKKEISNSYFLLVALGKIPDDLIVKRNNLSLPSRNVNHHFIIFFYLNRDVILFLTFPPGFEFRLFLKRNYEWNAIASSWMMMMMMMIIR